MSELYLVLRRRLESVADWVEVGTDVLQAAQDELGLSNEKLAGRLFVASKTWERWKDRGAVPRREVAHVARVLGLEVATPAFRPEPIVLQPEHLETLLQVVERLEAVAERLERAGHSNPQPQPRSGKRPRRGA